MKKLKLQMEDLEIETFQTESLARTIGTVAGHYTDAYSACPGDGCESYDTQCGAYSLKADPWGCTVGGTCDDCGPTNMVDCSWDGQCTWGGNDTCWGCESVEGCASRGVC